MSFTWSPVTLYPADQGVPTNPSSSAIPVIYTGALTLSHPSHHPNRARSSCIELFSEPSPRGHTNESTSPHDNRDVELMPSIRALSLIDCESCAFHRTEVPPILYEGSTRRAACRFSLA